MAGNTIGTLFRLTTFGESHGPALGCIVDGCPPGIPLSEADIQPDLDRRRPGTSRHTTQRREPDQVQILSGLDDGWYEAAPVFEPVEAEKEETVVEEVQQAFDPQAARQKVESFLAERAR